MPERSLEKRRLPLPAIAMAFTGSGALLNALSAQPGAARNLGITLAVLAAFVIVGDLYLFTRERRRD